MRVPTAIPVTVDPAPPVAGRSSAPDPASRVRRLVRAAREREEYGTDGLRHLEAALTRFDAPVDLRLRGGLGSGRRTLAAALRDRRGWRPVVDDLDELAAPGVQVGRAPDIEILCLRTAPCRHEEAWVRRPRAHALLVVATGVDPHDPPGWAAGLPRVDARRPSDPSVDAVIAFVDRAHDGLTALRLTRLASDLERLAVLHPVAEVAEAALCALDPEGRR